ncbi:MAG: translation elongation factor 4, partial [Candidatus Andersenbacteria bacterium]
MDKTTTIHNYCIIAHIDHGKSTLADRMLELTGTIEKRNMQAQLLDSMELEREKGITIKLQPVRMKWRDQILNLIDTPGHVDFQYEVSRSLQAVEGAILLVDATQGVQAQTIANLHLALEHQLTIIPVINKIDLPAANVPLVTEELKHLLGENAPAPLAISAKTGEGVAEVLDAIIARVPPAARNTDVPLKALIFDSVYDSYKGVVAYVRVVEGRVKGRDEILFISTKAIDHVVETGTFAPTFASRPELVAGEIGYIATGLKEVRQARVGDTITLRNAHVTPLSGFAIPQPKVFAGVYPESGDDFPELREAMAQLQLNDASLTAQQERSEALGQGFRCGFLGMLHLEIIQERLSREYDLKLVVTTPSVRYRVTTNDLKEHEVETPAHFPDPSSIVKTAEQYATVEILTPVKYMGVVFDVLSEREGTILHQEYLEADRILLRYSLPLRELVVDLYDQLKSITSGYGSMSYEVGEWQEADVVKVSILINLEPIEALSVIVARQKAEKVGRRMIEKL